MPIASFVAALFRKTPVKPLKLELDPPLSKEGEKVFADGQVIRAILRKHEGIPLGDAQALGVSFAGLARLAGDTRYHPIARLVLHEAYGREVPAEWAKQVNSSQGRLIAALTRVGQFHELVRKFTIQDAKQWDGIVRAYARAVSFNAWAPDFPVDPIIISEERQVAGLIDLCARKLLPELIARLQKDADALNRKDERSAAATRVRAQVYAEAKSAIAFGQFWMRALQQTRDPHSKASALSKVAGILKNEDIIPVARLEVLYPDWEKAPVKKWKGSDPIALIQQWHTTLEALQAGQDEGFRMKVIERLIKEQLDALVAKLAKSKMNVAA